jgi:hypothetical protein
MSAELADLAARIDYGYYSDEPRVIEGARAALERLGSSDVMTAYYRAFAALRLAQLAAAHGAAVGDLVADCVDGVTPGSADAGAAEAWILVAACSALGANGDPIKGLLHVRRRDQALVRARERDPENPRIALIEAWVLNPKSANVAELRDPVAAKLAQVVAGFASWRAPVDAPEWGEAEALARLGEIALQRGEPRVARDFIERALLLAPDYWFALALRSKLQNSRPAD